MTTVLLFTDLAIPHRPQAGANGESPLSMFMATEPPDQRTQMPRAVGVFACRTVARLALPQPSRSPLTISW